MREGKGKKIYDFYHGKNKKENGKTKKRNGKYMFNLVQISSAPNYSIFVTNRPIQWMIYINISIYLKG